MHRRKPLRFVSGMRGTHTALSLLATLALAGCAAVSSDRAVSTGPKPRAERPTYSVGDRWFRHPDGVTRKSRAVGGNQHPVMKGELEGVLPLVRVTGP